MHQRPRLDLTAKRAIEQFEHRIRYDYRRAAIAGVFAIGFLVASHVIGGPEAHSRHVRLIVYGCALGFVIAAVLAVRLLADEMARVSTLKGSITASGPLRVGTLLAGYAAIGLTTLDLLDLPIGHLLVGGAITGVVIGIAAQQALGNLFAGLVLLFTRPYVPGQRIRVRSGAIGGPFEGTVAGVGLLYTTLATDEGAINIPNSGLLAAAVGPVPAERPMPPARRRPSRATQHKSRQLVGSRH